LSELGTYDDGVVELHILVAIATPTFFFPSFPSSFFLYATSVAHENHQGKELFSPLLLLFLFSFALC
jgi:hypothetical protein